MSEPKPTLDPIGYRCDGCGRLFRDPWADLSAIRSAGGLSCCPERKPVGISARIEELEANLAKAVEALTLAANRLHRCAVDYPTGSRKFIETCEWSVEARAALAELTGGKDE